jgi:hypothetical protein
MNPKISHLVEIYSRYSEERLQEEIDAFFEIGEALLEVSESNSIETYPTTETYIRLEMAEIKTKTNEYLN